MSDESAPSTAGFNIPIPVDMEAVTSAMRKAIKDVSADLDALRKKAEEQMKQGGPVETALAAEIGALGRARASMRQSLEEKQKQFAAQREESAKRKKEAEAAGWDLSLASEMTLGEAPESTAAKYRKLREARLTKIGMLDAQDKAAAAKEADKARADALKAKNEAQRREEERRYAQSRLLHAGMTKLGVQPTAASEIISHAYSAGSQLSSWGSTLTKAGAPTLGGALSGAGATAIGAAESMAAFAIPLALGGAIAGAGVKLYSERTAAIRENAEILRLQAGTLESLTGGTIATSLQDGSTERAERVSARVKAARDRGMAIGTVGLLGYAARPFESIRGSQAETIEAITRHEAMLEEYRQKYGSQYNPYNNPQVHKMARLAFSRSTDPTKNPLGFLSFQAQRLYYSLTGEAGAFAEKTYQEFLRPEAEKEMRTRDVEWSNYQRQWERSPAFAVARVVENEKRRWLRDVEVDRVQRYNAWSMT